MHEYDQEAAEAITDQEDHHEPETVAKGKISVLPSLLTTASLFSGFYAIVSAINGRYFNAAVAIIVSAVLDGLDGRVARLTGTSSRFGMEYDSLCDLVAFGVAPALLAYQWVLKPFGRYGWLAAFLYVATTALRLARFNIQDSRLAKKVFTGLPCPAAGCMVATSFMFCDFFDLGGTAIDVTTLLLVYGLSYLMVSSFTYLSFKQPETAKAKAFQMIVAMVLVIMVLATEPKVTLFMLIMVYVLSAPVSAVFGLLRREKKSIKEQVHLI